MILASMTALQFEAPVAMAQNTPREQSGMSATEASAFNISGTWRFISGDAVGKLTLHQEPSSERCKRFTGSMDYPIDPSNIIGVYCPSSLRIYFGRYKVGEPTPFQMHEGHVNAVTGKYMAGSFFYWGNEGPEGFATNVFIGERQ
jgi:hypothetical protein